MRPRDLAALEFDQVLTRLADFAVSSAGKTACRALGPSTNAAEVGRRLEAAWQCLRLTEQCGRIPLSDFPDIQETVRRAAHEGFVLDGPSLVALRALLGVAHAVRGFLKKHVGSYPRLLGLPERLITLPHLHATLTRALDDSGEVADDASDELATIRRTICHLREKLTRRLEDLVSRPSLPDQIADRYVTIRNNRFVVPVWTSAAAQFGGVVQDRSVSGETTFIEPFFAVELNNRLLMAAKDEEAIIRRILADLTDMVRSELAALSSTFAALVDIDRLAAGAAFAQHYKCVQPTLDNDGIILNQARHPVLLFGDRPVTPIDIVLPPGKRILVITGPNTGGKTVALKTLGLLVLMAQSGFLIPSAEGSRLPCCQAVYTDVGDEQSIERNLSTFSAHVANLTDILGRNIRAALVLLDEPGVGTDPDEGAALGVGMIRSLEAAGARVVVSTHYSALKVFALSYERCATAAVDFDLDRLLPRYRLVYDSVGESLALPIARRLGLPEQVIDGANAARSEHSKALALAMSRLEEARRQYETANNAANKRAEEAGDAQREAAQLLAELREKKRRRWTEELDKARTFVHNLREQGRELIASIDQGVADRRALNRVIAEQEVAIAERANLIEERPAPLDGPVKIGDEVEVGNRGIRGQLVAFAADRAWVQRGSLRFEVPAAQLRRLRRERPSAIEVRLAPSTDAAAPHQISLLGLRARDAVAQLDEFLDRAARARHATVRIVHGIGSGALKRAVADYLATSPYCAGFHSGDRSDGGAGVTVAELASR